MAALVVDCGSGTLALLGFPGDVPLRAVFLSVVVRPEMLGIMSVMNQKEHQKDSTTFSVNGSGMCRAVFSSLVRRPRMLGIMAGMDHKDQVVYISFVTQRQSLMVQTVRRTTDIPQLPHTVIDVPVVQVQQFVSSCGRQLRSHSCSSSCLWTRSLTSLSWCRCRFPWSGYHRVSPVAVHR